jgi:hypothetical protein
MPKTMQEMRQEYIIKVENAQRNVFMYLQMASTAVIPALVHNYEGKSNYYHGLRDAYQLVLDDLNVAIEAANKPEVAPWRVVDVHSGAVIEAEFKRGDTLKALLALVHETNKWDFNTVFRAESTQFVSSDPRLNAYANSKLQLQFATIEDMEMSREAMHDRIGERLENWKEAAQ